MSSAYDRLPLNALRVFEAVATRLNFTVRGRGVTRHAGGGEPAGQGPRGLPPNSPAPSQWARGTTDDRRHAVVGLGCAAGSTSSRAALQQIRQEREGLAGSMSSTLSSFLQKWLTPRLIDLHERHPDIDFHIHASSAVIDFARTDFHAAIRLGSGHYPGLHTEKILDEHLAPRSHPPACSRSTVHCRARASSTSSCPCCMGPEIDWSRWFSGDTDCLKALRGAFSGRLGGALERSDLKESGLGFCAGRSLPASCRLAASLSPASECYLTGTLTILCVPKPIWCYPRWLRLRDWLLRQARQFAPPPDVAQSQSVATDTRAATPQPAATLQSSCTRPARRADQSGPAHRNLRGAEPSPGVLVIRQGSRPDAVRC